MTDYKIGEVARLLGLTTQALRFYEQEGVVSMHVFKFFSTVTLHL